MHRIIYKICIAITLASPIALQAMTLPNIKRISSSRAWDYVFMGYYSEAVEGLQSAAKKGSLQSAYCLFQQYKHGGLLTKADKNLAQEYQLLFERLIKEKKANQAAKIRKAQKKIDAMNCYSYAREHIWFSKIISFLQSKSNSRERFFYLSIEAAIIQTLDFFAKNPSRDLEYDSILPWLIEGINENSLGNLYDDIITIGGSLSQSMYHRLLIGITDWAVQHNHASDMNKKYSDLIVGYGYSTIETINLLRAFAVFDRAAAVRWLASIIKYLKLPGRPISNVDLGALALALEINLTEFNAFATELKDKKLDQLLKEIPQYPEYIPKFKGTLLDIELLVALAMDTLFARGENKNVDIFNTLAVLDPIYYQKKLPQFLKIIHLALNTYPTCYRGILNLLASPIQAVRQAALNTLQNFYIHCNKYYERNVLIGLLNANLEQVTQDNQTTVEGIFRHLNSRLCEENLEAKMQTLWMHLMTDPKTEALARELISCRLQSVHESAVSRSFDEITRILDAAEETGFQAYFNREFLLFMQTAQIFNTTISLKKRTHYLNQVLSNLIGQAEESFKLSLRESCESFNGLEEGIFKRYANTLIRAITPNISIYESFKAKRELFELATQESQLDAQPSVVTNTTGQLFNAYVPNEGQDATFVRIISSEFQDPRFPDTGLVFGFVTASNSLGQKIYRFYACEEKAGRAVWSADFKTENIKYALWDNKVYISLGENKILAFDTNIGAEIQSITLSCPTPIDIIEISSDGMLYSVQKSCDGKNQVLVCINLNAGVINYSVSLKPGNYRHYMQNNIFMLYNKTEEHAILEVYTSANTEPAKLDLPNKLSANLYLALKNNTVVFQSKGLDINLNNPKMLIGYDFANKKELWEMELPDYLRQEPIISADGTTMYITTSDEIIALLVHAETNMDRVLWRKPLVDLQIMVSEDGHTLYGLEISTGSLVSFDPKTGMMDSLGMIKGSHPQRLLKIIQDIIYIQVN